MIGLVFALDGTLVETGDLAPRAFDDVLRAYAVDGDIDVDDVERQRVRAALFPVDPVRACDASDVAHGLTTLLGNRFPADRLEAAFRHAASARVPETARPQSGARIALERIASLAIPAVVLTNELGAVARALARVVGFAGPVLAAEDIGMRADDAAAFAFVADTIGLPAASLRFVSTRRTECDAARAAGLRAVLIGAGTESAGDDSLETIDTLDDLPAMLASDYTRSLLGFRHVVRTALAWRPGHFIPGVDCPE